MMVISMRVGIYKVTAQEDDVLHEHLTIEPVKLTDFNKITTIVENGSWKFKKSSKMYTMCHWIHVTVDYYPKGFDYIEVNVLEVR